MNPYAPPDKEPDSGIIHRGNARRSPTWRKNKRPFIIALVVCGITQAFLPSIGKAVHQTQDYLNAFMGFIINFIMLGWCSVDAEERAVRISGLLRFSLIIISLIGVPWYFLRSRGFVGAFKNVFGLGLFAIWLGTLFVVTFGIKILEILKTQ
jgi:hypothetical protein